MLALQPIEYTTKDGQIKTHIPSGMNMSAADALRLVAKADHEGVQIFEDADNGTFIATSGTYPTERYYHTDYSTCTCPGFRYHGRCKHLAAVHRRVMSRATGRG